MKILLLLGLFAAAFTAVNAEDWAVCYFSSWAVYRPELGKFDVDDLDPFLCTHAIFGFAGLSNVTWTIEVLDPWNENCPDDDPPGDHCAYDRFVALKQTNPQLKTILSVGGWNEGSVDYSNMVADPAKRSTFIQSSLDLIQREGFDGLDMDWEYPADRGGVAADKENFIILLDEMRAVFDQYGLMITAALGQGKTVIDNAYDVQGLVRNLDVFSIMTYDYHGAWETVTHHNAPLCGYPGDSGDFVNFNVEWSINYWLSLGAPADKLVVGVPLYGRCFTLNDINQHSMLSPADTPGVAGPYTRLVGTQGYNELCVRLQDTADCTREMDPYMYEPYVWCRSDNLWCGFDDEESVAEKARFAKRAGTNGLVFWTVDTDDFVPTCGSTEFAMIKTAKAAFAEPADPSYIECERLNGGVTPDPGATTPPVGVTTTPGSGGVTDPAIAPDCSANPDLDFYPHSDCNKYWWCITDDDPELMMCSPGTYFNPDTHLCDYEDNIDTSHCNEITCDVDGTTYAGVECDEYYQCSGGNPVKMCCGSGLYFDSSSGSCVSSSLVDTSSCNVPTVACVPGKSSRRFGRHA